MNNNTLEKKFALDLNSIKNKQLNKREVASPPSDEKGNVRSKTARQSIPQIAFGKRTERSGVRDEKLSNGRADLRSAQGSQNSNMGDKRLSHFVGNRRAYKNPDLDATATLDSEYQNIKDNRSQSGLTIGDA